ncbi:MAG: B-box zinc finger protein [Pelolinea sp.]|nr:B-box zinc finger protein [Pelolinea sp.]
MTETNTLYCINHPNKETLLRCNQCEQPICTQCAIPTPTGYRCKSCVRGQQKKFNTAQVSDYIFTPILAGVLSYIGSYIIGRLGFLTIFITPFIGMAIMRIARAVIKNRRSNTLFLVTAGAVLLGSLPLLAIDLLILINGLRADAFSIYALLPLIWQGVYTVLVTGSVYYRLKGISF